MEVGRNGKIDGGGSMYGDGDGENGRLRSWPHSSRIIRVSRASGGKDRHSKVWTAKGPRDRRVRLSVSTAIQFYDLQDRLGVDQPSKAVEWLIKAAADSISELPSLNAAFPETPRQVSDERRPGLGLDSSAEVEISQRRVSRSRSDACSSNSETSKGSGGLSLSRNEIRVKARERARERTAKEKERETESMSMSTSMNENQSSASFTQLLTAGIGNMGSNSGMDYFNATGLGSRGGGFSGMHQAMMAAVSSSPYSVGGEHQHLPFLPDQDHYNLNFSISPSNSSGFNNRGTLQSNSSQSLLPQQQRFSVSPLDGTTVPFFLGAPLEIQHHQHGGAALFPPGLQLYYGDNDHKGKGKP